MKIFQSIAVSTTSVAALMVLVGSFAPSGVLGCAPSANASSISTDFSGSNLPIAAKGKHEIILGTVQDFNQDATASALQLIQYKIDAYAAQTNQKLPAHEESVIEGHGKILIRSLVDATSTKCENVKKFFRNLKPSFPNLTFVSVKCQDGSSDIIL